MSQQSLTFLSQASNELWKPSKPIGGRATFKEGNRVGKNLTLKVDTEAHMQMIWDEDLASEQKYHKTRPMRLIEYHYATMQNQQHERVRLGSNDIPPKPIASIPGYSGWVPRKEATNVIGCTYREGSLTASEIFAEEQETIRRRVSNILPPSRDLETPDTLRSSNK